MIETGVDLNANNVLDDAEVQSPSSAVCNGTPGGTGGTGGTNGEDGHNALIATKPEPAGANCVNGGVRIDYGTDLNDDNVLSPDEIAPTPSYICNVTGVRTRPEPEGANCRNGGTRLDVGIDKDGNGELSDAEVTSSEYFCDALRYTAVAAGGQHTCALVSDGTVRCWGYNGWGQNGQNYGNQVTLPQRVAGVTNVTSIVAGGNHSCALLRDGTVRCWGYNSYGQLGDNTFSWNWVPVTVLKTDGGGPLTGVTSITAGANHTCALVSGRVLCWGDGGSGQLGNDAFDASGTPVKVVVRTGEQTSELSGITAIYSGQYHNCAVSNGRARCWGTNGNGQLGNNTTANSATAVPVVGAGGTGSLSGIKSIAPGNLHTCAVVNTGARCWGYNGYGQLGDGSYSESLYPVEVVGQDGAALSGVTTVATSLYSACAVVGTTRTAVCWGDNQYGTLGNGNSASGPTPTPVLDLSNIESVSANDYHLCAKVTGDRLSCWGQNYYGQLGNGSSYNQSYVPTEVASFWYQ